jgi:hypothetical protein
MVVEQCATLPKLLGFLAATAIWAFVFVWQSSPSASGRQTERVSAAPGTKEIADEIC